MPEFDTLFDALVEIDRLRDVIKRNRKNYNKLRIRAAELRAENEMLRQQAKPAPPPETDLDRTIRELFGGKR